MKTDLASLLLPWEFSAWIFASALGAGTLYWLGCQRCRRAGRAISGLRTTGFYLGLALAYSVTHTYVDYLAQHMFWVHRLQHLVLHHLAAFLIILSRPADPLLAGLPRKWQMAWRRLAQQSRVFAAGYKALQNPVVAPLLFVGLVAFWLRPEIHFTAMLSATRYQWMNWSMFLDGLLFWAWVFPDRPKVVPQRHYWISRITVLWLIMIAQIIIGASIALSHREIYTVYAVCGRAWAMSAGADEDLGGLITWIPSAMMSVVAMLLIIRTAVRQRDAAAGNSLEALR